MEVFRKPVPENRIEKKHTSEKEKFRKEEEPHTHLFACVIDVLFTFSMQIFFDIFQDKYEISLMTGISLKFSGGGGEEIVHSRDFPPQGLAGAFSPLNRALIKLPNMIIRPAASIHEPIVEIRWPVKYCGG